MPHFMYNKWGYNNFQELLNIWLEMYIKNIKNIKVKMHIHVVVTRTH